jgi:hypothetical protein
MLAPWVSTVSSLDWGTYATRFTVTGASSPGTCRSTLPSESETKEKPHRIQRHVNDRRRTEGPHGLVPRSRALGLL